MVMLYIDKSVGDIAPAVAAGKYLPADLLLLLEDCNPVFPIGCTYYVHSFLF